MPMEDLIRVQLDPNGSATLRGPTDPTPGQTWRIQALRGFIQLAVAELQAAGRLQGSFAIQLEDEAPLQPCFRIDASWDEPVEQIPMIPDPYVLATQAFASIRAGLSRLPPWRERLPLAVWRGSSTGLPALTPTRLHHLPRYKLCRLGDRDPSLLDAGITAVVQAQNPAAGSSITTHLQEHGLLKPRMEPADMALHQWVVDLDGNVNSWGLLWKLLSGSCVVRVESARRQWYHHRIQPWIHVVPVCADLSDLLPTLRWCRQHPQKCAAIAEAGQRLALNVIQTLENDQRQAVATYIKRWM